jgi:glycosyltransferase involved in cell wall biosynthesis
VGGIRTHILYTYPHLMKSGYRFTFVGPDDDSFGFFRRSVDSWEGSEFVAAPIEGDKCRLRPAVRRLLKNRTFDLIHSHGLTAGVHAILANLGVGCPHVVTSHDVIRANQFPGLLGRLKRLALARILRRANVLITVSNDACENHVQYLPGIVGGRCRLTTIHNGIDVARFEDGNSVKPVGLRKQLQIGDDVFLMGFLGRFMEQKGFLVLVDALERLLARAPERKIHLAAVGSGDYLREYRAEVARRDPLNKFISFLPAVPDALPMLKEFDLLVMPSLWEAGPLLPMESLCLGVNIVGSDCLGLRETLNGYPARKPPKGDAEALCEAIDEAIRMPLAASETISKARIEFDIANTAAKLLAVYQSLDRDRSTALPT